MARTILKWSDEDFWDSSPRFLFKQFDIYVKNQEKAKKNIKNVKNNKNVEVNKTTVKKKFKVIDYKGA